MITTSGSPSFTTSPARDHDLDHRPATSASTGISIFIDSKITTASSAATVCPSSTSTFSTAATSSATTVWLTGHRRVRRARPVPSVPVLPYADGCELPAKTSLKSAPKAASWAYAEDFVDRVRGRRRGARRAPPLGVTPLGRGGASALTFLASALRAKAVVEIGTGSGVSGLALFAGMQPDGILTSVDIEADHQRVARKAFLSVGIPTQRFRLIAGAALNVLPRLSDGAYDLVFIDADKVEYPEYVEQGVRLLRHGGVLAVDNALWHDRVADPGNTDEQTVAIRAASARSRQRGPAPALLPVGDGLLVAVKR